MKKILLAIAAVATLFATSCKKESINPAVDVPEGSFLATIDNGANPQNAPRINDGMGTMTVIDTNRYVIWETGDTISINGSFYTTTSTPGSSAVFSGGNASGSKYHAFFPATIAGTDNAGTLPATQTYVKGKVSNLPMYACSENNQLTFHNICAALKITIPSFLTYADSIIISSSDKAMNGAFTVDANNKAVMGDPTTDADKRVKIVKSSGMFDGSDIIYVAVPAQTYSDFKVEFFNNSILLWSKTIESQTLQVNKVYNINATPMGIDAALCFTAVGTTDAVISMGLGGAPEPLLGTVSLEYCTYDASENNYNSWAEYQWDASITLNQGDKVYFRADQSGNNAFCDEMYGGYHFFSTGGNVAVSGNIMGLLTQNPATTLESDNARAFGNLFKNMSTLTDASGLILPATDLSEGCYYKMFYGCTALTAAPVLSAATLVENCYYEMFNGCTSLYEVTMLATNVDAATDGQALDSWLPDHFDETTWGTIHVANSGMADWFDEGEGASYGIAYGWNAVAP